MKSEFELSMVSELTYFLGLQVKQLPNGIFISQEKYVKKMSKKFGMEKANPKRTPAPTYAMSSRDSDGESVHERLYRSMIDSLLYLTASVSEA